MAKFIVVTVLVVLTVGAAQGSLFGMFGPPAGVGFPGGPPAGFPNFGPPRAVFEGAQFVPNFCPPFPGEKYRTKTLQQVDGLTVDPSLPEDLRQRSVQLRSSAVAGFDRCDELAQVCNPLVIKQRFVCYSTQKKETEADVKVVKDEAKARARAAAGKQ
uniref:Putative conserved secreted protein n=1 Tax=Culex tarsalis TaxID=7177 RepID=A0A1Q3FRG6_CULTA